MKTSLRNDHLILTIFAFLSIGLMGGMSACFNGSKNLTSLGKKPIITADDDPDEKENLVSNVVKNNQNPSAIFDLLGDGSGSLGRACYSPGLDQSNQNGSGSNAPPNCSCFFTYEISPAVVEQISMPIHYLESNMIRCRYDSIPISVSTIKVKILKTTSGSFSNEVLFQFDGSGRLSDYSNESNFVPVERYECRDSVSIPYFMEVVPKNLYDPVQSEDPHLSYPVSFYTTNMALALAAYAGAVAGISPVTNWNCPGNPRDAKKVPIYSEHPDESGSRVIYPRKPGTFDRSSFYLSRVRGGVFDSPVHAYVAPTVTTQVPDSNGVQAGVPPLGYGSKPKSTGVSGQEKCPDSSVRIPDGYQWVKVWLFKKQFPIRKYFRSNKFLQMGGIVCNPGKWSYQPANQFIFPDCNGPNSVSIDTPGLVGLSNRVIRRSNQCVLPPVAGGTTAFPGLELGPAYQSYPFAVGTDIWVPANGQNFCTNSRTLDYAKVCDQPNVPVDYSPEQLDLETTPRFEFLYVVTPVSVQSEDMANTYSPKGVLQKYTPFRYKIAEDCHSDDPDHPESGDCNPANKIDGYGIKFNDILHPLDAPSNSSSGVSFPVCALQRKEAN